MYFVYYVYTLCTMYYVYYVYSEGAYVIYCEGGDTSKKVK